MNSVLNAAAVTVQDAVAHSWVVEGVNDVLHIHDLLLPMIVIDTQSAEEYKQSSFARLTKFADCHLQSGPRHLECSERKGSPVPRKIAVTMFSVLVFALG